MKYHVINKGFNHCQAFQFENINICTSINNKNVNKI